MPPEWKETMEVVGEASIPGPVGTQPIYKCPCGREVQGAGGAAAHFKSCQGSSDEPAEGEGIEMGGGVEPDAAPDLSQLDPPSDDDGREQVEADLGGERGNGHADPETVQQTQQAATSSAEPLARVACSMFEDRMERAIEGGPSTDEGPPPKPEPISDEEKEALADAWETLMATHGEVLGKYAPALNAVATTAGIALPRLLAMRQRIAWERSQRSGEAGPEVETPRRAGPDARSPEVAQDKQVGERFAAAMGGM